VKSRADGEIELPLLVSMDIAATKAVVAKLLVPDDPEDSD
jgi:hypothetical protein